MERLQAAVALDVWEQDCPMPRAELLRRAGTARGLLCMLTDKVDAGLLAAAVDLAVVSSMSVGVDHVDIPGLQRRGIALGNTPGVLVETTADLAFGLLLSAARRISEGDAYIRSGQWQDKNPWGPMMFAGKDVAGATLGIVGMGEIGQAVARRATGFGMKLMGWTRSGREVPGVESVSLAQLLRSSDFVSINVALTENTFGLIGAQEIDQMKAGAVLVNTARGGIVDEQALAEALSEGRLHSAGIDVFSEEPLAAASPLRALPNCVLTPHIGSATLDTRSLMAELAVDNLLAGLADQPLPHAVT
jgi:glyoxylate reductase